MAASQTIIDNQTTATWVWDTNHLLYYSPESGTYAYTDQTTGEWHYIPASSLASSSTAGANIGTRGQSQAQDVTTKEEGEIEDDVGWGGLMEPEELDKAIKGKSTQSQGPQVLKHPAYGASSSGNGSLYDSLFQRAKSPSPPKETPKHLLRLVVLSSPSLPEGHVAIIDAREGGVQLGRDRCEKGGHARVRVKEMEVSKNHAVVYWGLGGEEEEGWWIVDLGSTHGTFVTRPTAGKERDSKTLSTARTAGSPHRLSEPKVSSLPFALAHSSVISIGQTTFEVHNHSSWPCESCQLGRNNEVPIDTGETKDAPPATEDGIGPVNSAGYAMNSAERRGNRETNRKREMAALKDTLLNRNTTQTRDNAQLQDGEERQYLDRSAIRRKLHPREPPHAYSGRNDPASRAQAQPSVSEPPARPAPVSAFAQSMMAAQGYVPGAGLGKDKRGRSEAIEVKMRVEKRGLGAKGAEAPVPEQEGNEDWRKKGRTRRFDEMKGW